MAVDATGTPTSPDSIPTYNTAADNPSGKGFNNAMAAIQTALSNRPNKPAGIVTGEAMIWNGSTFVRSSATQLGLNSLATGSLGQRIGYPVNGAVPQAVTPGSGTATAASKVGTTSTAAFLMAGMGLTVTPTLSGTLLVVAHFNLTNGTTTSGAEAQLSFGTGAAPVNGAAAAGTAISAICVVQQVGAGAVIPGSCVGLITGATIGTPLWIDLQQAAITSGTMQLQNIRLVAVEL